MTAPAGFGRRHVANLIPQFLKDYPDVTVALDLTDRVVDIVNEGFDLAIRIGTLDDSNLIAVKLADNRRVVVASPLYVKKFGKPIRLDDLAKHRCLTFGNSSGQSRGWTFTEHGKVNSMKVPTAIECNDGAVLHDWALAGEGLAWRSMWEVAEELSNGSLVSVLDEFAAPANAVYAVFPERKHLPLRLRVFIDLLKTNYNAANYWERRVDSK